MTNNPYAQPGKHFVPRPQFNKVPPHKGNWNLVDDRGSVLLYNKPYAVCRSGKKDFGRKAVYKNVELRIVPCLK